MTAVCDTPDLVLISLKEKSITCGELFLFSLWLIFILDPIYNPLRCLVIVVSGVCQKFHLWEWGGGRAVFKAQEKA